MSTDRRGFLGTLMAAGITPSLIGARSSRPAAALNHLISGVKLQPSGVFAALRAQEAGCHYILATDA